MSTASLFHQPSNMMSERGMPSRLAETAAPFRTKEYPEYLEASTNSKFFDLVDKKRS
jgi:hypothetical protein